MSYSSYFYLFVFLEAVFLLWLITPRRFRWATLLLSSYAFYCISSGKRVIFLMASTLSVYLAGVVMNRIQSRFDTVRKTLPKEERKLRKAQVKRRKRTVLILALVFNFGLLVFLKYLNFLGGTVNGLLDLLGIHAEIPTLKLLMPLGISYYTLMAASYLIDVYRGKYAASANLGKVALFLSFFPQITEGPIGRFDLLADQLYEGHKFDYQRTCYGIQLIFWGLFKKLVIADRVNAFVSNVIDNYSDYSGVMILLAMLLYTLQIYADFSGCIDIVTGTAQIFGVNLSKNFERPFFSRSVNEFWQRWHITLGTWLRDYVFYSVSLSKGFMKLSKWARAKLNPFLGSLIPAASALFCVWLCNGFWHGASWKYVSYGLYYYVIMLAGMLCEPLFRKFFAATSIDREGTGWHRFQIARTFLLVNLGMLLFRAPQFSAWPKMIASIFTGWSLAPLADGTVFSLGMDPLDLGLLILGTVTLLVVGILQEKGHALRQETAALPLPARWSLYLALILAVIVLGAYGNGYEAIDAIYGQF